MVWKLATGLILTIWLVASVYQYFVRYELHVYDCKHMSLNQGKIFKKLGFGVKFMEAELEDQENHVYLRLSLGPVSFDWEPVRLMFGVPIRFWFSDCFVDSWEIGLEDITLPMSEIRQILGSDMFEKWA